MKRAKRQRLEKAGWRVGSVGDFLGLSEEETALIEMKLALADSVKKRRLSRRLTQAKLARQIGSSQARIAKMEAADPSVSIDLLVRALLALGATRQEVARIIGQRHVSPAA